MIGCQASWPGRSYLPDSQEQPQAIAARRHLAASGLTSDVALVGSRARGTATVNSDTDVVVLADDPLMFRTDDY